MVTGLMHLEMLETSRKTRSMGIRLYDDQIEDLHRLTVTKHRNRLKISDLVREAIDQYIDREKPK
jgi:predicted transcriptional regulator